MIGGGIFSTLGVSVDIVGKSTPIAILLGGGLAFCAAYSFFKKTFPKNTFSIALIGWLIIFESLAPWCAMLIASLLGSQCDHIENLVFWDDLVPFLFQIRILRNSCIPCTTLYGLLILRWVTNQL